MPRTALDIVMGLFDSWVKMGGKENSEQPHIHYYRGLRFYSIWPSWWPGDVWERPSIKDMEENQVLDFMKAHPECFVESLPNDFPCELCGYIP